MLLSHQLVSWDIVVLPCLVPSPCLLSLSRRSDISCWAELLSTDYARSAILSTVGHKRGPPASPAGGPLSPRLYWAQGGLPGWPCAGCWPGSCGVPGAPGAPFWGWPCHGGCGPPWG